MKTIDFTQPGGFPLTQDQLGYLQQAYVECISSITATGDDGSGAPIILKGLRATTSSGTTTISPGWLLYNGELVLFAGGAYSTIPPGDVPLVTISSTVGTLTFNDGSTPGVILDKTATLSLAPSVTDATNFPFSALVPFGYGFGKNNREQVWSSLVVNTAAAAGGVTGTIYYKKDFTANSLHLRGALIANNAQNFAASPGAGFSVLATLPSGYIPNNSSYFIANYYLANLIKDDLGISWIKQINCAINTSGQLYVNFLKPDISTAGYGINFNTIIPLD